jgi:hypothetical protein
MNKLKKKIKDLAQQNEKLDSQLKNLELVVNEREEIHQAQGNDNDQFIWWWG